VRKRKATLFGGVSSILIGKLLGNKMRTNRKSIGRLAAAGLLIAGFAAAIQPTVAAAQRSKKDKGKDQDQQAAQTGAQCAPGTGSPSGAGTASAPTDDIIRQFAQHESDFKLARDDYTYSQSFLVQEADGNGVRGGEYQLDSEIIFTPQGRRYEHVIYAPPPTLQLLVLGPEDMKDLENIQPFVLTTEELPKYEIQYAGTEKLDELNTYKFCVGPKRIEKSQRYFRGTIWVDGRDLAVVKSDGKAVPEIGDQRFPRFVTYRENIEGTFWFPTYTHADDVLHFSTGPIHMRMTIRYANYKRFGATIKIGSPVEIKEDKKPNKP